MHRDSQHCPYHAAGKYRTGRLQNSPQSAHLQHLAAILRIARARPRRRKRLPSCVPHHCPVRPRYRHQPLKSGHNKREAGACGVPGGTHARELWRPAAGAGEAGVQGGCGEEVHVIQKDKVVAGHLHDYGVVTQMQ